MNPLRILNYIRQNKLTKAEFCKLCKIKVSMLDDIIYYGKTIDFKIAERMAESMGLGVYELFMFD